MGAVDSKTMLGVLCRRTALNFSATHRLNGTANTFCSLTGPIKMPYPEWVDGILNGDNAAGPRGNRQAKRMKQRDRQRRLDHKRRIMQTAAAKELKQKKQAEKRAALAAYKKEW